MKIITETTQQFNIAIWAYCLMPDHVHLIAVPDKKESLSIWMRSAHTRYARYINRKTNQKGQFWQGRYASHILDETYLIACTRYIEINPVKRAYVVTPEEWPWSSARAHITGNDDELVQTGPLLKRVTTKWQIFLAENRPPEEAELFYQHEKNGQPLVKM